MTPEIRGRRWAVEQYELGLRMPQILPDFDPPQSMAQRAARRVLAMAERWLAKRLGADRRAYYAAARATGAELLAAAAVTREAYEDMREAVARGTTADELLTIIMPLWRHRLSTCRRARLDGFVQAHRPAVMSVLTDFLARWAEVKAAGIYITTRGAGQPTPEALAAQRAEVDETLARMDANRRADAEEIQRREAERLRVGAVAMVRSDALHSGYLIALPEGPAEVLRVLERYELDDAGDDADDFPEDPDVRPMVLSLRTAAGDRELPVTSTDRFALLPRSSYGQWDFYDVLRHAAGWRGVVVVGPEQNALAVGLQRAQTSERWRVLRLPRLADAAALQRFRSERGAIVWWSDADGWEPYAAAIADLAPKTGVRVLVVPPSPRALPASLPAFRLREGWNIGRHLGDPQPVADLLNPPVQRSRAELRARAKALLSRGVSPLYKGLLRTGLETDAADLAERVEQAERNLARNDAEYAEHAAAEERRQGAAVALLREQAGHDPQNVLFMWKRLRHQQDRLYAARAKMRPDDRTARKAHRENRLDANAHELQILADTYRAMTGKDIGGRA